MTSLSNFLATNVDPFKTQIAAFFLGLLAMGIAFLLRPKTKLVWSRTHAFQFLVTPEPGQAPGTPFPVTVGTFYLINAGRLPARNVEATFAFKPNNFQLWPWREFDSTVRPDGVFVLRFNTLSPKERVQLEMLTVGDIPLLTSFRCDESFGEQIESQLQRVYPKWWILLAQFFALFGMAAFVYLIVSFLF